MPAWQGPRVYADGLRASVIENATAYGFSIMVTGTFGVINSLEKSPRPWEVVLWAFGAVAGFTLVTAFATKGFRDASTEAEKSEVEVFAAFMNFFSVLSGVGSAALLAWLAQGWYVWLFGPVAASATYVLVNGFEYAAAEEEEEEEGD